MAKVFSLFRKTVDSALFLEDCFANQISLLAILKVCDPQKLFRQQPAAYDHCSILLYLEGGFVFVDQHPNDCGNGRRFGIDRIQNH
ncbi:hypothetical protein [Paenibacillus ihumii]|uniref:hypothetical protein n=1 Tax=Paenibacillus ihumii TaxID=687436 RepID=UPI001CA30802|nr:hypothetical protein [Paenibacillus ihumii]